ncbi:MAG: guanylate kinase [Planctomycetota bacterium]|nr:MAG: guanylate kinase [Planctomycetota bacterium]
MSAPSAGNLIVISGPSGAGKTTLLKRLYAECPGLKASVSATTRSPRPGERDGVDYHFLSPEEFERKRQAGEFLESCEVFGRGAWYGTLESEVAPSLAAGKSIVLEIDVQGAMSVLERYPDALTIFVHPGSLDELRRRLSQRGTDSQEAIERRMEVARRELDAADRYRYQVLNDDVARAVREICEIVGSPKV